MRIVSFLATWILLLGSPFIMAQRVVLVLNKTENSLAFLDPGNLALLKKIPTGDGPHEIAITRDGRLAVVANYGSQQPGNTLSIVDVPAQREIRRLSLGALLRPHGLTMQGHTVYFTAEGSRAVGRYDLDSGSVDWITGTGQSGTHMLALLPDGRRLYTANRQSNSASAIDIGVPALPEHIAQIAVGGSPEGIDVSPDGNEIWIGSNDEGRISIIETRSNSIVSILDIGGVPIRIKFSPDGQRVFVSDRQGKQVVVIDAGKRQLIKKIPMADEPIGIVVTRDGKTAYISLPGIGKVCKLDLGNFSVLAMGSPGENPDGIGLAY